MALIPEALQEWSLSESWNGFEWGNRCKNICHPQQDTINEYWLYLQLMASSFHLFLLILLFLALFQEGWCAELLFLFLGLTIWGLRLPRLLGCDGDLHRFLIAQAQLWYLNAQILLQFCQVILPVGNSVCQQMQWWGKEWGMACSDYGTRLMKDWATVRQLELLITFNWRHHGRQRQGDGGAIKRCHLICIWGVVIF